MPDLKDQIKKVLDECRILILGVDHAHNTDVKQTPDVRRLIHQDHDVERVAFGAQGGGDESEVERECQTFREQAAQSEHLPGCKAHVRSRRNL